MEEREIQKFRKRFILIAMISVVIVMIFIATVVAVLITVSTHIQYHSTLDSIVNNYERKISGNVEVETDDSSEEEPDPSKAMQDKPFYGFSFLRFNMMQGTSFLTVELDEDKNPIHISSVNLDSLEDEDAVTLAGSALKIGGTYGRFGVYNYRIATLSNGDTLVVMLNSQEVIYTQIRLFILTFIVLTISLVITYFIIRNLSLRAIQPTIENAKRQKEFITNASHELKTPLAVIRANTEFTEMMNGKTEWTESTLNQVDRMNGLIQNLVMITRAAEQETSENATEQDISTIMSETVEPFAALAKREEKALETNLAPAVKMYTDGSAIRMLASTLVDNAIKYCDDKGKIEVRLVAGKRQNTCTLTVSNSYADGANIDCRKFFDRFYRQDQSHHADGGEKKSGYGIGLSVAESIAERNGGNICVDWKDGVITFTANLVGSRLHHPE